MTEVPSLESRFSLFPFGICTHPEHMWNNMKSVNAWSANELRFIIGLLSTSTYIDFRLEQKMFIILLENAEN